MGVRATLSLEALLISALLLSISSIVFLQSTKIAIKQKGIFEKAFEKFSLDMNEREFNEQKWGEISDIEVSVSFDCEQECVAEVILENRGENPVKVREVRFQVDDGTLSPNRLLDIYVANRRLILVHLEPTEGKRKFLVTLSDGNDVKSFSFEFELKRKPEIPGVLLFEFDLREEVMEIDGNWEEKEVKVKMESFFEGVWVKEFSKEYPVESGPELLLVWIGISPSCSTTVEVSVNGVKRRVKIKAGNESSVFSNPKIAGFPNVGPIVLENSGVVKIEVESPCKTFIGPIWIQTVSGDIQKGIVEIKTDTFTPAFEKRNMVDEIKIELFSQKLEKTREESHGKVSCLRTRMVGPRYKKVEEWWTRTFKAFCNLDDGNAFFDPDEEWKELKVKTDTFLTLTPVGELLILGPNGERVFELEPNCLRMLKGYERQTVERYSWVCKRFWIRWKKENVKWITNVFGDTCSSYLRNPITIFLKGGSRVLFKSKKVLSGSCKLRRHKGSRGCYYCACCDGREDMRYQENKSFFEFQFPESGIEVNALLTNFPLTSPVFLASFDSNIDGNCVIRAKVPIDWPHFKVFSGERILPSASAPGSVRFQAQCKRGRNSFLIALAHEGEDKNVGMEDFSVEVEVLDLPLLSVSWNGLTDENFGEILFPFVPEGDVNFMVREVMRIMEGEQAFTFQVMEKIGKPKMRLWTSECEKLVVELNGKVLLEGAPKEEIIALSPGDLKYFENSLKLRGVCKGIVALELD